jgi:hypothetical protein
VISDLKNLLVDSSRGRANLSCSLSEGIDDAGNPFKNISYRMDVSRPYFHRFLEAFKELCPVEVDQTDIIDFLLGRPM